MFDCNRNETVWWDSRCSGPGTGWRPDCLGELHSFASYPARDMPWHVGLCLRSWKWDNPHLPPRLPWYISVTRTPRDPPPGVCRLGLCMLSPEGTQTCTRWSLLIRRQEKGESSCLIQHTWFYSWKRSTQTWSHSEQTEGINQSFPFRMYYCSWHMLPKQYISGCYNSLYSYGQLHLFSQRTSYSSGSC